MSRSGTSVQPRLGAVSTTPPGPTMPGVPTPMPRRGAVAAPMTSWTRSSTVSTTAWPESSPIGRSARTHDLGRAELDGVAAVHELGDEVGDGHLAHPEATGEVGPAHRADGVEHLQHEREVVPPAVRRQYGGAGGDAAGSRQCGGHES